MNVAAAPSTKDRILDAAEHLIAKHGFEATSLRAITAEADVNLAAVNYHFQSKEALIRAVIARRIGPINEKRLAMLDAVEAAAGEGPLPLASVIEAFVAPVIEIGACAKAFGPIMGRALNENTAFAERFFHDHIEEIARRFTAALSRAVPGLSREEVIWRAFFLIGAMAHTLVAGELLKIFSAGACRTDDLDSVVKRLVSVFTAGFQAPALEQP